ncbi:MAG: hypothetical protein U9R00_00815 [Patescibacteria group bacterium]|nr:hypothetical protein [Patescibacteria group bacterium]
MNKKPKKGEYLKILLRSPKTIFSIKDASLLWKEENNDLIKKRLSKYVKTQELVHIRRGLYAKDNNYSRLELATRINTPSYVSFETVLVKEGIVFQNYGNIFVASYLNREMEVDGQKITFIRIKDYVLSETTGIEHKDGYATATKERAFLDRIYVSKNYHFDNLGSMDWDKINKILPIYNNKKMEKRVKKYFINFNKTK